MMVSWHDHSWGIAAAVSARRLGTLATPVWATNGVALAVGANNQTPTGLVSDGQGGAISTFWNTFPSGQSDIVAQRVEHNGYWGYPSAWIARGRDIPGDQGGYVNVSWSASRLDAWPGNEIYQYTVWRSMSAVAALAARERGEAVFIQDAV